MSNSREELVGKMQLYFAAGAREMWFCDENGRMEFRSHETLEPLPASRLCPEFPAVVEWE